MPKQKTHKGIAKRFKITKTGKVLKRMAGQGHFNARETGKVRRSKRMDQSLSVAMVKHVTQRLPHNN
ncbi:MAG: hypothetical protein A2261_00795 [Candidatus Magasanikbacteria bacterium RIFOXYA2_FULL_44_8]|uniref:Large ribosomal subunit protein bL35 n=1 Tax=Candidatus Magasanikbacteria bacterium RIFOXYA2_FULL_44_8 TaxID=1798696 RepID=A0A1F6NKP8_9BACT|nr:MAG: hypothetical protein A2261_00795 [Candidatus Magasanikbacteria bacterium RIFOXYA2_FULL_44_8]